MTDVTEVAPAPEAGPAPEADPATGAAPEGDAGTEAELDTRTEPASDTFVETAAIEDDDAALFAGDTGVLPFEARRVLALVMQRRYLSAAEHPAEWKALLAHQQVLSSRLHDLFVELVVDRDYEIAYKRQVRCDGLAIPVLLRDEPYKRVETLLMLYVRTRYHQEQGAGHPATYVDAEDMTAYALGFLAHDETNLAARHREIDNAIAALVRERVLDEVATGRYRVGAVVEILLPVDRMRELTAWLRGDGGAAGGGADGADGAAGTGSTEGTEDRS